MEGVTKKAYLITGGSGGIGSELCKKIFDKGVIPIITCKENFLKFPVHFDHFSLDETDNQ